MSGSVSVAKDDTLNTSFVNIWLFHLYFLFLQVPHKFCCAPVPPMSETGGHIPRQLYGAGAYVGVVSQVGCWRGVMGCRNITA